MTGDSARWVRIDAILDGALDLPASERPVYLERACAGDADLMREVVSLLEADARADGAFLGPMPGVLIDRLLTDGPAAAPVDLVGRTLGAYRLTGRLGEGGMGTVYEAERADGQFQRTVAVKMMKWSGTREDAWRRFVRERQILAGLDHPHIARLLDGGVTDDGVPYFVMERVTPGTPITDYCEARRLDLDARLRLMLDACDAVHHAHQALVVHRDLKPSNILVDDAGSVRLLDFGIAKLLADDGAPFSTQTDARPMTPAFAAPEQVDGSQVTTATDVYALGAVLYVVLTGRLPYDVTTGRLADWSKAVLETTPKRPSAAVSDRALATRLRGDLDRILLKALEKDPARRYASAEALAADIRRHLGGLPVEAHEPSRLYLLRKFVARNRLLAGGVAATLVALAVGLGATLWQARIARAEARRAEAVQKFLVTVFEQADPDQAKGKELTAREIVDKGSARIETEFANDPAIRATLWTAVGELYGRLGAHAAALAAAEHRVAAARAAFGADGLEYARALLQLAGNQSDTEDHAAARRSIEAALPTLRRDAGGRSDDLVNALNLYGGVTAALGDNAAGVATIRQARDLAASLHGADSESTAQIENDLAVALGDADEALDLTQHVAAVYGRVLGTSSYSYSLALYNLGNQLFGHGRWAEAADVFAKTVPLQERLLGERHPETALSYRQVARLAASRGDFDLARAMMAKAIAALESVESSRTVGVALARGQLANIERMSGRFDAAIAAGEQAAAALRAADQTPSNLALVLMSLSPSYRLRGDVGRALATAREGVRISEGADQRWLGGNLLHLGEAQLSAGARQDAVAALMRAPQAFEAAGQARTADRAAAMRVLADASAGLRPAAEREQLYRNALELFAAVVPPEQADALDARLAYAAFLRAEGRQAEALPLVDQVLDALGRSTGVAPARRQAVEALKTATAARAGK